MMREKGGQCQGLSSKKLNAKEAQDLSEQIEDGQSTHDDGQGVGGHIVGEPIGVASHQPFLVHQRQNRKEDNRKQEAIE